MRVFIHHDLNGNITSVTKTEIMDASLAHPYGSLPVGGNVLEVDPTAELQKLACHEIGQGFAVDIKKKGLRKIPVITDKDVKPVIIDKDVKSVIVDKDVKPVIIDKDVKPVIIDKDVKPVITDKDVKPVIIGKDPGKQK